MIGKLLKPKSGWTLPGHKYTGPYNDLDSQVKYDPKTEEKLEIWSSVIPLSTHQFFETESQKPALFAVFSFLEQFFSSSTVVSVAKANVLQMPTIAVFARNWCAVWSGADANFAPFRWRIWLPLSEFLCFLVIQNVTFLTLFTLFCTKLPFFLHSITFFLHRVT